MAKQYQIPLSYNAIDEQALLEVLRQYRGIDYNQITKDLENLIAREADSNYAVVLNSGTAALHLALRLLDIGTGDAVLVSTFTYIASVSPILYCGATPVFIDSEEKTWNMDPDLLEKAIHILTQKGQKPKAIILVHAYGVPADLNRIVRIANYWNIPLIEDAAGALGASVNRRWVGTVGELGVYSFNCNKTITGFGGGALLLKDKQHASRARFLSRHAHMPLSYYQHTEVGYNYAISPLSAAYCFSQFIRHKERIENRMLAFEGYKEKLQTIPGLGFQKELPNSKSARWLCTFSFEESDMENLEVVHNAQERGFEFRRLWKPMHMQPVFFGATSYLNGVSEHLFSTGLCLPSGNPTRQTIANVALWLQKSLISMAS